MNKPTMGKGGESDIIPKNVIDAAKRSLVNVEELSVHLLEFLTLCEPDVLAEMPPLQRAQALMMLAKATSTLYTLWLRCSGVHPDDHPVKTELERLSLYHDKLDRCMDLSKAPLRPSTTLNYQAATRFIEHSLPDLTPDQRQSMRDISRGEEAKNKFSEGRNSRKKRKCQSSEKQSVRAAAQEFLEKAAKELLGDSIGFSRRVGQSKGRIPNEVRVVWCWKSVEFPKLKPLNFPPALDKFKIDGLKEEIVAVRTPYYTPVVRALDSSKGGDTSGKGYKTLDVVVLQPFRGMKELFMLSWNVRKMDTVMVDAVVARAILQGTDLVRDIELVNRLTNPEVIDTIDILLAVELIPEEGEELTHRSVKGPSLLTKAKVEFTEDSLMLLDTIGGSSSILIFPKETGLYLMSNDKSGEITAALSIEGMKKSKALNMSGRSSLGNAKKLLGIVPYC
ncbi:hypothetical protein NE237_027270 [Protea cynaroides]|uniref:Nuclear nucleic acid-binding protein C1D n=1 Tax=Protea cynaroides TaxID=273540 RepID=A0A9Q0GPT7_9MAGN|nr:hypothetical protein NE237_027270 [Protea cynaroides]